MMQKRATSVQRTLVRLWLQLNFQLQLLLLAISVPCVVSTLEFSGDIGVVGGGVGDAPCPVNVWLSAGVCDWDACPADSERIVQGSMSIKVELTGKNAIGSRFGGCSASDDWWAVQSAFTDRSGVPVNVHALPA